MWCERNDECRRLSSRTIAPCTAAAAAAATAAATPCKSTAVTICVVSDRADPDCIRWNVSLPRIALLKKNRMVRSSNAFGFHVFLLFRVSFRFFFSHIYGRWIPLGLRWWCHRHQKKRTLWKKTEFLDKNISSSFWQIVHWSQPFSEARRRSIR